MTERRQLESKPLFAGRIQPAYQQVADQLRSSILKGEINLGERLPVESSLAAMFGVSRSTIREALRVLSSERLVSTVRGVGGGSFVSHPDSSHVSDFLRTSIGLLTGSHQVSLAELIEARERLEIPSVRFAAERATPDQVADLEAAAAADLQASPERWEKSRDFHFQLLHAAGNRLMQVMAGPVFSVLAQRYLREDIAGHQWEALAGEHRGIAAAIAAGDSDAAAALMGEHIRSARSLYREEEPG